MMGPTYGSRQYTKPPIDSEAYHERAEIRHEVESLVCPSFMEEHQIRDHIRLESLISRCQW